MTDARMPERYLADRRVNRLSDAAFRAFVTATVWSVSNRTDGIIHPEDLPLIRGLDSATLGEMLSVELCARTDEAWLLVDFAVTQTSKHELEVLENVRRAGREKKARQRGRKSNGVSFDESSGAVPGDVPGDVSPGQHRQGKARDTSEKHDSDSATDWPVATIPGAERKTA